MTQYFISVYEYRDTAKIINSFTEFIFSIVFIFHIHKSYSYLNDNLLYFPLIS